MNNDQIKKLATIRLGGNWGNCIALGVTMLSMGLLVILGEVLIYHSYTMIEPFDMNYFDYLATPLGGGLLLARVIAYYLMFVPEIGYMRSIYASLSKGVNFIGARWAMRHQGFGYYAKTICIQTISLIYQAVLLAPLIFASTAVYYYMEQAKAEMNTTNLMMFMLSLLIAIILLFLFIFMKIKLRLIPFILAARKDIKITHAFALSVKLMKGNTLRYILFLLSFAKYLLLCLLIIPIIVILPYYNMSITIFCQSLVTEEKLNEYISQKEQKA